MAGAAEGDQGGWPIRGPAVVDDEGLRSPADAAEAAVAGQDLFAAAGEARPRAAAAVVAALTEPAAVELGAAAEAAQRDLREGIYGAVASHKSPTIRSIIISVFYTRKQPFRARQQSKAALDSPTGWPSWVGRNPAPWYRRSRPPRPLPCRRFRLPPLPPAVLAHTEEFLYRRAVEVSWTRGRSFGRDGARTTRARPRG